MSAAPDAQCADLLSRTGGGFGRKLANYFVAEAALIAEALTREA